ncbi:MFS transporter [Paenibacillus oenotherae]|uniref:MFS transporter n=1 Tax=Paenibacillus oenotherae TaxID=1435645 RepID=A0ABS7D5Y7_9BACL|nr:MFS transporter [Paenibacillus oenotherae]MBW7475254.1 MFS transporter [Paenibacillus oenotherae]
MPIPKNKGLSKTATIFTLLLGIFMGALDHGIVGPALSSIIDDYSLETSWGVWSFTVYTLLFAVSIPILGKLSDRFGRKQTFMFGITMFAAGSLIAALAPNFTVFLIGRGVQAIGTGGIFPISAAQIAVSYSPEKRGRMLGLIGVVFGVGTILGPLAGGLIVSHFVWQVVFLINIPISVAILILAATIKQEQQLIRKAIDSLGIILLTAIILSLMLGITLKSFWIILIGILLVPLLILVEKNHEDPIMRVTYFTKSNKLTLLIASMISGFVMATATNLMPYFAENVLNLDKGAAGMSVAPLAIASMVASLIGGMMVDKLGANKVLITGFLITLAAAVVLSFGVDSLTIFYPVIILMGFGIGIIIGAPLNILILQAVDNKETGSAIGYLSLFRSLGSTLGPTTAGLCLVMFNDGFEKVFMISGVMSLVSLILIASFIKAKPAAAKG